ALGSCLALSGSSSWLWPVGWFGFAFAVAAGANELAGPGAAAARVAPAAGLGLAALLLGYQVVVPASVTGTRVGSGPLVVAGGVVLTVVAAAVLFALDRRNDARSGPEPS